MADFKIDIEVKFTVKPLTPKIGLKTNPPMERNLWVMRREATRFLNNADMSDIADLADNTMLVPTRLWPLGANEPCEVIVEPASDIATTGFTLNAKTHSHGTSTNTVFEYGKTPDLGTSVNASTLASTTNDWVARSAAVTGATANTQYFFRVKAVQGSLTIYSPIMTFKTLSV